VAHLNNAGAALPPSQVTEAVIDHLRREAEFGGYEAADAAAAQVEEVYVQRRLSERGVNTSVSLVHYARLDLAGRGLPDLVHSSVHYYNTDSELDRLIDALALSRVDRVSTDRASRVALSTESR
jgi:selenocysteine lyase/cysteine desulfurase